jgi:DNA-binding MarR family transcriptional regulator
MAPSPAAPEQLAHELRLAVGLVVRRLRHEGARDGELTMPEASALGRLDRGGTATAAQLAKAEQISPQSIGATIASLQRRGLIRRDADPDDGRRITLSLTPAGAAALHARRSARTDRLARALEAELTGPERRALAAAVPLLRRLAENI